MQSRDDKRAEGEVAHEPEGEVACQPEGRGESRGEGETEAHNAAVSSAEAGGEAVVETETVAETEAVIETEAVAVAGAGGEAERVAATKLQAVRRGHVDQRGLDGGGGQGWGWRWDGSAHRGWSLLTERDGDRSGGTGGDEGAEHPSWTA